MPGQEEEDDLLKHGWDRKPAAGAVEQQEESVNLADLILEKIAAHEAAESRRNAGMAPMGPVDDDYELPPKVVEVYSKSVFDPSYAYFLELVLTNLQSWRDFIPIQVWAPPEALQDPPNHPSLGRHHPSHRTREVVPKRLLPGHSSVRLCEASHRSAFPRNGDPRPSP
jgi:hypothetical protein